jgi:DNA repair exonuclease SbcCD ATPase subunit
MVTRGRVAGSMRETIETLREEVDRLREREVDVARVLDLLGEDRAALPRLAREVVERLRQRVEELERERNGSVGWRTAQEQKERAEAAEAEVARLRAALWFYADESTVGPAGDEGRRARAALAPAQPEEPLRPKMLREDADCEDYVRRAEP